MNNNLYGANQGRNIAVISYHTIPRNQADEIMREGILDRYLIGQGIIPYNFNYNENVYIRNCMIIDYRENRFIYDNRDIQETLMNAVMNNLPVNQNNNYFYVISFRHIDLNANNLDELSNLVAGIIRSI